jgi:hypothetical protein
MIQDVCSECWNDGHLAGHRDGILHTVEIIKSELHKFVIQKEIIYVTDVIKMLDEVRDVLCKEANPS